jgi:hypothetical protein
MKAKQILIGASFLFYMNCSTSRIVHTWKSPNLNRQYASFLVIGLFNIKDSTLREKVENHLVGDFREKGCYAISSFKKYGSHSFLGLQEDEFLRKFQDGGTEGIVTIVLLDKKNQQFYDSRRILESPDATYQRRFWGYYSSIYDLIDNPGYYQESTSYFWESNFYNMEYKELLYSVQTKSFDPKSTESLADEFGKLIVNDMQKNRIIK